MTPFAPSRREFLAALSASTAAVALPGCAAKPGSASTLTPAALLNRIAERLLAHGPEGATSLGIDSGARAAMRGQLGDRSETGVAALARTLREDLAAVETINAESLDPATRTSVAVIKSAYRVALDGFALPYGDVSVGGWRNTPYVVIQNVGAYLDTPRFLDAEHPVKNASDAEAYLSRLSAMSSQLDGELERLRATGAGGVIPPAFLLDKTLTQIDRTIADAERGGGLVSSLVNRTKSIAGDWERRAAEIVGTRVLPALKRQRVELAAQRSRASDAAGLWARPRGDEFYAWALRASTTTRMTPEEIHREGFDQLKLLQDRMEPILKGLGYSKGTVGERMAALGDDPRFTFSNDDKGRADVIALMQNKVDYIRGRMPEAFRRPARGNLEIRRLPPAEEAGAPGAYGGAGSIDGTVPGKIWLNLGDVSRHSKFSLATLAFHEGIPGHVWQGEYANQLPLIRTLLQFNAYSEGWALYSETLGDELGAYEGDPVGQLGYLQSIAFRACRLVVDTGLHAKRWTRDQAIDWFMQANGSGRTEVSSEVDRYCSWSGQACGYKIGHSEILRQRQRARTALGAKYDLRDFNQAVVEGGNVPLDVLAQNVERYIAAG
jgi:uncharacterized protein (DUF885 family)